MDSFDLRLWPDFLAAAANHSRAISEQIINHVAIDSRCIHSSKSIFFALQGRSDGHQYVSDAICNGAKFAVVDVNWQKNPHIAEEALIRVHCPLDALQSLAKSYRRFVNVPTIAICGSFGKTMVKDFMHLLLSTKCCIAVSPESFNSQIGVALSLFQIKRSDHLALIEAGISKIGEMHRLASLIEPQGVIFTHLGKKHLATLGSMETVASEMMVLLAAVPANGWVVMPQHPLLESLQMQLKSKILHWNVPNINYPEAVLQGYETQLTYSITFPCGFVHMKNKISPALTYFSDLLNICLKTAWKLDIQKDDIIACLELYRPEMMQTEIWKAPMGATFISDTYCSDPQSFDRALQFYEQAPNHKRRVLVLTGLSGKGGQQAENYRRIGKALLSARIDLLFLVGPYPYSQLIEEVRQAGYFTEIILVENPSEMFTLMTQLIKCDDIVLVKGHKKEPLNLFLESFNGGVCNNIATVNFAAISANIALLRQKLPHGTRIMPTVKAFAYGTDEVHTAKFLASCGIDILCLSTPDEAVALKRAGATQALFVINAPSYEAKKVVRWGLEVGISQMDQIHALAKAAQETSTKVKVHLHVDTGMNRFGCRVEEAQKMAMEVYKYPQLILEGIMTHFVAAESLAEDDFTTQQIRLFDRVIENLKTQGVDPLWKHAANSAGAIRFHLPQYNMVRIGLALYGLHASTTTAETLDLRQALSLRSRIVGINLCKKDETVSYGRSYKIKQDFQRVAVIPLGYFDGIHRHYSEKGDVLIRGIKAPMVGKICMDYMMVDITQIPDAAIGDTVLIFGEDGYGNYICPQELASKGDSIVHQLITCLGPRIQRVFAFDESRS